MTIVWSEGKDDQMQYGYTGPNKFPYYVRCSCEKNTTITFNSYLYDKINPKVTSGGIFYPE